MISDKVRPHHLEGKAILYVRQSSWENLNPSYHAGFKRRLLPLLGERRPLEGESVQPR
jgi:hypothetical protein